MANYTPDSTAAYTSVDTLASTPYPQQQYVQYNQQPNNFNNNNSRNHFDPNGTNHGPYSSSKNGNNAAAAPFYYCANNNGYYSQGEDEECDEYDDEQDEVDYYQQQLVDYAELQRQDAEYESQLLEQDVHISDPLTTAVTAAPLYYQGSANTATTAASTSRRPTMSLDIQAVEEQQQRQEHARTNSDASPGIITWADDEDECLFSEERGRQLSLGGLTAEDGEGSTSPHDSDYFNLSSTSSGSPTKSQRERGGNASFGTPPSLLPALDEVSEDEETTTTATYAPRRPATPVTVTTYCNFGAFPMLGHEFLDLEEQRCQVSEDRWRDSALWCERQAEAAKLSPSDRKVAVKLLIDEAFRLELSHVRSKFGAESPQARICKTEWTQIGKSALAEIDAETAALAASPRSVHVQQPDPSHGVIRKFSSMGIFISGQGSRTYAENEDGKFNRLEAQAKVLDSLIFSGRLFCPPPEDQE